MNGSLILFLLLVWLTLSRDTDISEDVRLGTESEAVWDAPSFDARSDSLEPRQGPDVFDRLTVGERGGVREISDIAVSLSAQSGVVSPCRAVLCLCIAMESLVLALCLYGSILRASPDDAVDSE